MARIVIKKIRMKTFIKAKFNKSEVRQTMSLYTFGVQHFDANLDDFNILN